MRAGGVALKRALEWSATGELQRGAPKGSAKKSAKGELQRGALKGSAKGER